MAEWADRLSRTGHPLPCSARLTFQSGKVALTRPAESPSALVRQPRGSAWRIRPMHTDLTRLTGRLASPQSNATSVRSARRHYTYERGTKTSPLNKLGCSHTKSAGELPNHSTGWIASAEFEIGNVGSMNAKFKRECFLVSAFSVAQALCLGLFDYLKKRNLVPSALASEGLMA